MLIKTKVSPVGFEASRLMLKARGERLSDEALLNVIRIVLSEKEQRDLDHIQATPGGLQWLRSRPRHPDEKKEMQ